MWIGSNVPPRMPSEPATGPAGVRRDRGTGPGPLTRASHGSRSHSSSTAPIRTVSPVATPARRSSASTPSRDRSRWNRSADSSTSKSVWAAIRSIRRPRTRNAPSGVALDGEAVAERLEADGRRRPPAPAADRARRRRAAARRASARSSAMPVAGRGRDRDARPGRPAAGRPGTPARRPAAVGRSILLNATSIGFSRSAGSCASSSSRMTPWSHSGSRAEPSTTWTRTRVRSTWRRKAWPRPAPWLAPSMRPGTSAIVGRRSSSLAEVEHAEVRLEGRERVVGDLRAGGGERREEGRLAGVRQPDEADVGDQPQLEADPALLARLALLGVLRGLVGRRREVDVAEAAPAAAGDHGQLLDRRRGRRSARRSRRRRRPCPAGRRGRGRGRPCRGGASRSPRRPASP